MIEIRVRFSKSIFFAVFLAAFFGRMTDILLAYTAAFLHELSHLWMCRRLGADVYGIRVGIFGICLKTGYIQDTAKKIAISAAGPFASLLLFCVGLLWRIMIYDCALLYKFVFFNLCIGVVNLIPVMPLDGGAIVKALLMRRLGIIRGTSLQWNLSAILLMMLTMICLMTGQRGYISISFYAVIIFLLFALRKERQLGILEKKMVLCGQIKPGNKIRYIATDGDSELLCLAENISFGFSIVAAVFYNGRFIGELNQSEIIYYIKQYGALAKAKDCVNSKILSDICK